MGDADSAERAQITEQLRQQRNQARSIAQCIARQTSSLAEELYRLKNASGGGSPQRQHRDQSSLQGGAGGGADPERIVESSAARQNGRADGGSSSRGVSGGAQRALRPPDEVTSGWDVFDPDDQIENTMPATTPPQVSPASPGDGRAQDIGGAASAGANVDISAMNLDLDEDNIFGADDLI